jgi:hypothetical protein
MGDRRVDQHGFYKGEDVRPLYPPGLHGPRTIPPDLSEIVVVHNTPLFRATPLHTAERNPTPRFCSDTHKTGVYFSAYDSYLSECMPIEYQQDMEISEYKVLYDTHIPFGKFAYRILQGRPREAGPPAQVLCDPPGYPPTSPGHNISHFETRTGPRVEHSLGDPDFKPYHEMYAEVFLNPTHLHNIEYVDTFPFRLQDAEYKWVADYWYDYKHRPGDPYVFKPPRHLQQRLKHHRNPP